MHGFMVEYGRLQAGKWRQQESHKMGRTIEVIAGQEVSINNGSEGKGVTSELLWIGLRAAVSDLIGQVMCSPPSFDLE